MRYQKPVMSCIWVQITNQKNGDYLYNTYIEYMIKIAVLGAGMIGRAVAVDLQKRF